MGDRLIEYGPMIHCSRDQWDYRNDDKKPKSGWEINTILSQAKLPNYKNLMYFPMGNGDDMWLYRGNREDIPITIRQWSRIASKYA